MYLANHGRPASDEQVVDFLRFAVQRRLNLNDLWVAETSRPNGQTQIVWTILPIVSPGRTMLLSSPAYPQNQMQNQAAGELVGAICDHWAQRGIHLAQVLLEVPDRASQELYCASCFDPLAELIYLQTPVGRNPGIDVPQNGYTWQTYGSHNHAAFAHLIAQSYEQSLDCPSLNGRRDIEDVIAGHKAAGEFDPSLWLLLREGERALGVLLLGHWRQSDVLELVYLGLTPAARGRGLADLMMQRALLAVPQRDCSALSLAVDSRNVPALALYYRHGMQRVCTKLAMLRDLRNIPQAATMRSEPSRSSH